MTILIPSYEPGASLHDLIEKLKDACDYSIVVVDDGSGDAFKNIFDSIRDLGCTVLIHNYNQGKGCALKTGFEAIRQTGETEGVICADSDGQHLPKDIMKAAEAIKLFKDHIVLGCRLFTGKIPFRSRFGNSLTRKIFALSTGQKIYDTQTGLRGYPAAMLDWLCHITGERYEYEMNILLEASRVGYIFDEMPIDTVYFDDNKSSHFRTFTDSIRVYLPILKFSASSIVSGILDFCLLFLIKFLTSNLLIAAVGTRIISSASNYFMNKSFVFIRNKKGGIRQSLWKYYSLATLILALNYSLLFLLSEILGIPLFFAKLLTEAILFMFSYWAQRNFVFKLISGTQLP